MKKIETIWHHLLEEALIRHQYRHTQKEIATRFHYSLSTVHHALIVPAEMGMIRKEGKFFVLAEFQKLLYYWASIRNLSKDIIYTANADLTVQQIEGFATPSSIFAGYSAARYHLKEAPADYAKVFFYILDENIKSAEKRFPNRLKKRGEANVIFLRMPKIMAEYGAYTTLSQTFVDIWNSSDWYSKDFCKALEEKMHGLLS